MSFMRRALAQVASARAETRGADPRLPWGDSVPPSNSMVGVNAGGIPVTGKTATGVTAVYACCSLLADTISSLPLELRDGPRTRGSKVLPDTPLMEHPYAEISRSDWWVQFMWGLALHGNFFGRIIQRDRNGLAMQVKPISQDDVRLKRNEQSGALEYRYGGELIPQRDVVHVRYQSQPGDVVGLSPVRHLALTLGIAIAQKRFQEGFFLNSALPMGVIEVPAYLDRVETRKMMRGWIAAHQGLNNVHAPAILTEGATFKPITISPQDSQLLEALQYSASEVAGQIFRIPPHMVGITERTTAYGRGIEQHERSFVTNALQRYLTLGQEVMSNLSGPKVWAVFDTTERTRGAILDRARSAALLATGGIAMADDTRPWFDWDDMPDGEGRHPVLSINTQLLEQALLLLQQQKEAPNPLLQPAPAPGEPTLGKSPNGTPPGNIARPRAPVPSRSNGHEMTEERAWEIVYEAVSQAKRMEAARAMALGMEGSERGED